MKHLSSWTGYQTQRHFSTGPIDALTIDALTMRNPCPTQQHHQDCILCCDCPRWLLQAWNFMLSVLVILTMQLKQIATDFRYDWQTMRLRKTPSLFMWCYIMSGYSDFRHHQLLEALLTYVMRSSRCKSILQRGRVCCWNKRPGWNGVSFK